MHLGEMWMMLVGGRCGVGAADAVLIVEEIVVLENKKIRKKGQIPL